MKVCLAQILVEPCRPDLNYATMTNAIVQAKSQKADMVVFPELCIPGYLIGDTWEEEAYLRDCIAYGEQIQEMADGIIIVFGNIAIDEDRTHQDGRIRKFNALFCAENRKFRIFSGYRPYYIKSLLPNYREFEEPRHFTHSEEALIFQCFSDYLSPIRINKTFVGFSICEDGWDKDYRLKPIKTYADNGAELIINISGSPFTIGKNNSRNKTFGEGHAKGNSIPLIYVNCVGIQNNGKNIYTFDGSSVAYNSKGEIVAHAPMFEECLLYVDYENGDLLPGNIASMPQTEIEEIEQALMYGARKFLQACGINKIVIGLSGGIDSAVSAVIYSKIVGPENLLLVNMPSIYNSKTTIDIAEQIAKNIGCYYTSIDIEKSITLTLEQIQGLRVTPILASRVATILLSARAEGHTLELTPFHLENVQARDRGSRILSAIASAWGGVFPNNGNKSEITVGYCTFYGDLAGFLCTIGDLWKEQVYALGRHLNDKYHLLPEEVFTVHASAELSEDHDVDKGKGDPLIFWYHDRLFQSWMQWWIRVTPEENLEWYIDGTINEKLHIPDGKSVYDLFQTKQEFCKDLEHWYKAFKGLAVAKRIQAPPILAVSRRAFGFDYRETLGGLYLTRRYHELKGATNA